MWGYKYPARLSFTCVAGKNRKSSSKKACFPHAVSHNTELAFRGLPRAKKSVPGLSSFVSSLRQLLLLHSVGGAVSTLSLSLALSLTIFLLCPRFHDPSFTYAEHRPTMAKRALDSCCLEIGMRMEMPICLCPRLYYYYRDTGIELYHHHSALTESICFCAIL